MVVAAPTSSLTSRGSKLMTLHAFRRNPRRGLFSITCESSSVAWTQHASLRFLSALRRCSCLNAPSIVFLGVFGYRRMYLRTRIFCCIMLVSDDRAHELAVVV